MNVPNILRSLLAVLLITTGYQTASAQQSGQMVRLSAIEIDPAQLEPYKAILAEESAAPIKLEPGVVAIFPMYQNENPTSVRMLEIYASRSA